MGNKVDVEKLSLQAQNSTFDARFYQVSDEYDDQNENKQDNEQKDKFVSEIMKSQKEYHKYKRIKSSQQNHSFKTKFKDQLETAKNVDNNSLQTTFLSADIDKRYLITKGDAIRIEEGSSMSSNLYQQIDIRQAQIQKIDQKCLVPSSISNIEKSQSTVLSEQKFVQELLRRNVDIINTQERLSKVTKSQLPTTTQQTQTQIIQNPQKIKESSIETQNLSQIESQQQCFDNFIIDLSQLHRFLKNLFSFQLQDSKIIK